VVDFVSGPMRIIDRRQARTLRRNQRPMWLPIGPLLNPGADERFLFRPEMLVRLDRRHPVAFFLAENPRHKLAVLHVARYDRLQARVGLAECAFLLVQPKTALALRFVKPMAGGRKKLRPPAYSLKHPTNLIILPAMILPQCVRAIFAGKVLSHAKILTVRNTNRHEWGRVRSQGSRV